MRVWSGSNRLISSQIFVMNISVMSGVGGTLSRPRCLDLDDCAAREGSTDEAH